MCSKGRMGKEFPQRSSPDVLVLLGTLDTVEMGWEIVQSVMDVLATLPLREFPNYRAGLWGPRGTCRKTKSGSGAGSRYRASEWEPQPISG